jgi:formiminotetrahydrofolate cyclodeaminase
MATLRPARETPLGEYLEALGSPRAVPGSGSAAAVLGALGASLALKALASSNDEGVRREATGLKGVIAHLLELADRDAEAYERFRRTERDAGQPSPARELAIEIPLEIAAAALDVLESLGRNAIHARAALRSEVELGARALSGAVEGATAAALANAASSEHTLVMARCGALVERARKLAGALEPAAACGPVLPR